MFAVIESGAKQYQISVGNEINIEKITGEVGNKITLDKVLVIADGENVTIGTPIVEGAVVEAEITRQFRAKKVIAFKKRRRQNSKRSRGHRQALTAIKITAINPAR